MKFLTDIKYMASLFFLQSSAILKYTYFDIYKNPQSKKYKNDSLYKLTFDSEKEIKSCCTYSKCNLKKQKTLL